MSRNTKIVLAILAVGAVAVGLLGYWASVRRAKQTMAATATVIGARWETRTGKRGKDKVIVTVSYSAGTTLAQGNIRVSRSHPERYPAGRAVRICYDPTNTTSIRKDDGPCG